MDETNLEEQLRSWKPRRPSRRLETRLFGAVAPLWPRGSELWSWLTPMAVCALTLLVQAARQPALQSGNGNDAAFFATLMVRSAALSNTASYCLSRNDENVEWNVWPHAYRTLRVAEQGVLRGDSALTNQ